MWNYNYFFNFNLNFTWKNNNKHYFIIQIHLFLIQMSRYINLYYKIQNTFSLSHVSRASCNCTCTVIYRSDITVHLARFDFVYLTLPSAFRNSNWNYIKKRTNWWNTCCISDHQQCKQALRTFFNSLGLKNWAASFKNLQFIFRKYCWKLCCPICIICKFLTSQR